MPVPIAPNKVIASAVSRLGDLETKCREWPQLVMTGEVFSLPLDNGLIHVILDGKLLFHRTAVYDSTTEGSRPPDMRYHVHFGWNANSLRSGRRGTDD